MPVFFWAEDVVEGRVVAVLVGLQELWNDSVEGLVG